MKTRKFQIIYTDLNKQLWVISATCNTPEEAMAEAIKRHDAENGEGSFMKLDPKLLEVFDLDPEMEEMPEGFKNAFESKFGAN